MQMPCYLELRSSFFHSCRSAHPARRRVQIVCPSKQPLIAETLDALLRKQHNRFPRKCPESVYRDLAAL